MGLNLKTDIEFIKGIGPKRAELLRSEKGIYTLGDLFNDFPFRYVDKTKASPIAHIMEEGEEVLIKGKISSMEVLRKGRRTIRMQAIFQDSTGVIELIWFQGIAQLQAILKENTEYLAYGKVKRYGRKLTIAHPELELIEGINAEAKLGLAPIYHTTEKLTKRGMGSKFQARLMQQLVPQLKEGDLMENLPQYMMDKLKLMRRSEAYRSIHFPKSPAQVLAATNRLKFEELFYMQLRFQLMKQYRKADVASYTFEEVGSNFNTFYDTHLPFELTGAQKRVIKEIRRDLGSGFQMNRLLQGDVGSGKTIVSLLVMLIAMDNGFQSCIMAPTEILAQQHYASLRSSVEGMPVRIELLTGSVSKKEKTRIYEALKNGEIDIIVGTHALIEDVVQFQNLGLCVIDEQHRFGVAQRAKLWKKATPHPPHILVMSATPIPRTLAMSTMGDLDISVIDELPPGRKPIMTLHYREKQRPQLIEFMRHEISKGRQIYLVYPLIEESETLDLANLDQAHAYFLEQFPQPEYQISLVHGRMKSEDKAMEMQRFVDKKTQILIATTVIEVGVNVPNASVMVIENAERFGLSQLHQLRGRVGRGAEQSYCILMSGYKLTKVAKQRIAVMCRTNDGFEIAEADLDIRGPGEIDGTRQSGDLNLLLANPTEDKAILYAAQQLAATILEKDPQLKHEANAAIRSYIQRYYKRKGIWSRVS